MNLVPRNELLIFDIFDLDHADHDHGITDQEYEVQLCYLRGILRADPLGSARRLSERGLGVCQEERKKV